MSTATTTGTTAVSFTYSDGFPDLLREAEISLAVSTYQAGQLALLKPGLTGLDVELHGFERVMGIAYRPESLAVATASQIWYLPNSASVARQMNTAHPFDAGFLARRSHFTGEIQAHELRWAGEELWVVNTLFSCLCTIRPDYSFAPRWKPKFISGLAAEDRCHLNGFAMRGAMPAYVTSHAETDTAQGWRQNKNHSGCIIDVKSGETILRGLAMPHSPRLHGGKLWACDSGTGRLIYVDTDECTQNTVAKLPGYTRGLGFHGKYAFVGLSKIRETAVFGGVPIAELRDQLKCGLAVVDLMSGQLVATFQFQSAVEEIFDVVVLSETRNPTLRGPQTSHEQAAPAWVVPEEARAWADSTTDANDDHAE